MTGRYQFSEERLEDEEHAHIVVVDDGNKMHGQLQVEDGKGWQVVWTCSHQHLKESSARKCAVEEQARLLPAPDKREESVGEAMAASDRDGYGDEGAGYDMAKFATELEARGWVFRPAGPPEAGLEWHEGKHGWLAHDGYRRHSHSQNGVLTIDPHDTTPHLPGMPFRPVREPRPPEDDTPGYDDGYMGAGSS